MTIEIMLPFYGSGALLREAVDSVLAQDDPDWQLTVVDDAYPDPDAAGWLADLGDGRVTYLRNERNLGVSGSFQRCLELASADWLVIMGGDDRMLPGYVAAMRRRIAAHPEVAFIQPGVRVIDADGAAAAPLVDRVKTLIRIKVDRPTVIDPRTMTESLLRGNWMYFPAMCWRRDAVAAHGFEPHYATVPDWWLMLRLLQEGAQVLLDPDVTFEYRRHAEQASTTSAADVSRFHEEKAVLLAMREVTLARGWHRASRRARWHPASRLHALVTFVSLARTGRVSGGRQLLAHAFTNRWPPQGRP